MDKLKAHEFFEGIDFDDISNQNVPISENLKLTLEMQKKANDVPFHTDDLDSDDDSIQTVELHKARSEAALGNHAGNQQSLGKTANPRQLKQDMDSN
jgi:hypothetical protein